MHEKTWEYGISVDSPQGAKMYKIDGSRNVCFIMGKRLKKP